MSQENLLINEASSHSEIQNPNLDKALYPGTSISLHVALVLILAFVVNHKISNEALEDLLSLVSALILPSNILPKTLYKFYKYLNMKQSDIIRCYFCPSCQHPIDEPEGVISCPNSVCDKVFSSIADISYFVRLPLEKQIQDKPGFLQRIKHRFTRPRQEKGTITDIYDGSIYKGLAKTGGILSKASNISLLWNTDGVPVFKSSHFSIWPLFFVINELPYRLRMKWQNIILAGMWFGSNMKLFLRQFQKILSKLETEGIVVKSIGHERVCS